MSKRVNLGLAAAVLAASTYFGINANNGVDMAEARLQTYPSYVKARYFDNLSSRVRSARSELNYSSGYTTYIKVGDTQVPQHHPPSYPDPRDARKHIATVLKRLQPVTYLNVDDLKTRLEAIRVSLPDQNNIRRYGGESVRNSTFRPQKEALYGVAKKMDSIEASFMKEVPDELKSKKNWEQWKFYLALFAAIGALGFGGYTLTRNS